jgi:hypothetical protein
MISGIKAGIGVQGNLEIQLLPKNYMFLKPRIFNTFKKKVSGCLQYSTTNYG